MNQGRLKDRVAMITGGARGIGKAAAFKMVKEGASVALLDILPEDLARLGKELKALGGKTLGIETDVTQKKEVEKAVEKILSKWGRVDILVNNAGIVKPAPLENVQEKDWDQVVDVNLKGAFFCTRAVLPSMKTHRYGKIVNLSSRASLGKELRTVYAATKAALIGLTRTWALELAQYNINVNAIAPGPIATELFTSANPADSPRTKAIINGIPLKRMGQPEDVGNLILFLASDESSFITGQVIFICGGITVGLAHY
ncbi:MAG: SDR family oxidoreductase [Syntrophaceae bacterium]|jgi:NAD(P)-dependent dehydrogenase (short-subunit alcohol dehydrogenase family)|nr:SDR family oxidoreductase [Syntrophaceae bacterium]